MAIGNIILMGFGNGTFSPGIGKLPTIGYGSFITFGAGDGGGQHRIPPNRPGQVICQNKPGHRIPTNRPGQVIPGNDDL